MNEKNFCKEWGFAIYWSAYCLSVILICTCNIVCMAIGTTVIIIEIIISMISIVKESNVLKLRDNTTILQDVDFYAHNEELRKEHAALTEKINTIMNSQRVVNIQKDSGIIITLSDEEFDIFMRWLVTRTMC